MSNECIQIGKAILYNRVRASDIDTEKLCIFLREYKKNSGVSNNQISDYCDVPLTKVEYYFRMDKSFAIPDATIWDKLKEILKIDTSIYDDKIKQFIDKKNNFDMTNRVYSINGKSPTLTAVCGGRQEKKIATGENTWRKLTPTEYERLQTVPDDYTSSVSKSQRYKMLGNGWTVDVITHILQGLKDGTS